ncbi:hypothetical protein Droror1_Dr00021189 [Drosera rotundifolia]
MIESPKHLCFDQVKASPLTVTVHPPSFANCAACLSFARSRPSPPLLCRILPVTSTKFTFVGRRPRKSLLRTSTTKEFDMHKRFRWATSGVPSTRGFPGQRVALSGIKRKNHQIQFASSSSYPRSTNSCLISSLNRICIPKSTFNRSCSDDSLLASTIRRRQRLLVRFGGGGEWSGSEERDSKCGGYGFGEDERGDLRKKGKPSNAEDEKTTWMRIVVLTKIGAGKELEQVWEASKLLASFMVKAVRGVDWLEFEFFWSSSKLIQWLIAVLGSDAVWLVFLSLVISVEACVRSFGEFNVLAVL